MVAATGFEPATFLHQNEETRFLHIFVVAALTLSYLGNKKSVLRYWTRTNLSYFAIRTSPDAYYSPL
jgi:hypothetical protein